MMKRLISLLAAIALTGCNPSPLVAPRDGNDVVAASQQFKSKQDVKLRPREARVLYPHIQAGMTREGVRVLLGDPDTESSSTGTWFYTVGYSQFITVHFTNDVVERSDGGNTFVQQEEGPANKVPEDTARRLADPQH